MSSKISIIYLIFFLLFPLSLHAQSDSISREVERGDKLRESYRFEEAVAAYEAVLETLTDSLLRMDVSDRLLMAENGLSMMDFVYKPDVVARHRFSVEDFFLYYPLPEKSWYCNPSQLDTVPHHLSKAFYFPDSSEEIYWSAADAEGARNIYRSEFQDTVWTVPALLNESLTTMSDEIYPMLSPDGKKLYFSSSGLYGVGGQDLYVSEWNDDIRDWSLPVNMGFPYSSPADDFLLVNSEDGIYTVFASNRDCHKDSVWVYVLEYDDMPVRYPIADAEELLTIAQLAPGSGKDMADEVMADIPENVDTRRYMSKMTEVRSLRDSISALGMKIEDTRIRYAQTSRDDEKASLENDILGYELYLPVLQDSLEQASRHLQDIEMEFLFSGVVIDPEKLLAEADREIAGQTADYVFTKREKGSSLFLNILKPEPKFDYSFKVLEEGQFAEDNTLPSGLIYQIQMFSLGSKATVKQLNGLSPVFESVSAKGRYVYRVGLFNTYNDVLAHLNTVKKSGCRNAFIVAFNDGKELTVSKARVVEKQLQERNELFGVRINTGMAELDAPVADGIRQQASGKDIARSVEEGGANVYIVSPFAEKTDAESVAGFVRAMGVSDVIVYKIK